MPRAKIIRLKSGEQIKDVDYTTGMLGNAAILLVNVPEPQLMEAKKIFGVEWLVPAKTDATGRAKPDRIDFIVPVENIALIVLGGSA